MFTPRFYIGIVLSVIILGIFVVIFLWPVIDQYFFSSQKSLATPVLVSGKNLGLNQWFPQNILGVTTSNLQITAKSAFFVDTKTGEVLFSKNPHARLPIASLVKVMTVLIAVEHRSLDEKLVVSESASSMEPDKMWLQKGEALTLKELLYGIFLISANDGAEVLAQSTTGRREEFMLLMNSKAMQLGMKDTFFANPTGLDEDSGNSYSSAYDLSLLSRFAIRQFPFLVDFSKTEHIILPKTVDHQDYDLYSGINLLTTYPGVVGFKTGYTPEAGLTLITLARRGGHEVLGVLLGSLDRRDEAREILNYSFKKLGVKVD